jgi:heme A synthase
VRNTKFEYYAHFVVVYIIGVIIWGAYVRASGSGAGCGEHWPLCNGVVIPQDPSLKTLVEFGHRVTSGLALLFVGGLYWGGRRLYPDNQPVRIATRWSMIFILGEAAVGAMLVLLSLVANNDSGLRAIVIALHLVNTLLLLYWLVYVAIAVRKDQAERDIWLANVQPQLKAVRSFFERKLTNALYLFGAIGATGAIVALGDTLFPSVSLTAGLYEDLNAGAHFLIRLRVIHPVIAILASVYIAFQMLVLPLQYPSVLDKRDGQMVVWWLVAQLVMGGLNVVLLAPVWLQLIHLFVANIIWIQLVSIRIQAKYRATGI